MSRHGQVILMRMIEMIDHYEAHRSNLRRLVDDLGSMYQSLEPSEQPPEKAWRDAFTPLDELISDRSGRDQEEMRPQIDGNLSALRGMLESCRQMTIQGAQ
jgi:hypothetical protein